MVQIISVSEAANRRLLSNFFWAVVLSVWPAILVLGLEWQAIEFSWPAMLMVMGREPSEGCELAVLLVMVLRLGLQPLLVLVWWFIMGLLIEVRGSISRIVTLSVSGMFIVYVSYLCQGWILDGLISDGMGFFGSLVAGGVHGFLMYAAYWDDNREEAIRNLHEQAENAAQDFFSTIRK